MAIKTEGHSSRRTVLGAGLGGLAALVAQALGRPAPVRAGVDGDVILGSPNAASSTTGIASSGNGAALEVTTSSDTGWAIHATSTDYPTVFAVSANNAGLDGVGHGSNGAVLGQSVGTGPGVLGTAGLNHTTAPSGTGIFGYGSQGIVGQSNSVTGYVGVQGFTGAADPPSPAPVADQLPTGAYGEAEGANPTGVWGKGGSVSSGFSTGVYGEGDTGVWGFGGWGVFGASSATGTGVYGFSGATVPAAPAHTGVFGYSDSGFGIYARSATGTALYVNGKARFSRSGRTYISAGHSTRKIYMAGVTTSSYIIATPQTNRAGVFVQSVVPASGSFTIHLNKAVSGTTYVGYLVIN
jgi:hypothetical protein